MAQYTLYKRSDTSNPFVIVNENTIDSSSTSVFLIGKRKESYGQPEQQSKIWMLENFANAVPPSPAMVGQEWFRTGDNKMYVCTDTAGSFTKIGSPIVSASQPSTSDPYLRTGDLWFNSVNGILYAYNGATTTWQSTAAGTGGIPSTVQTVTYLTTITNDGTPTVMNVLGTAGQLLSISPNTSWNVSVSIVGRKNSSGSEAVAFNLGVLVDRNDVDPISIVGGIKKEVLGASSTLAASVDATIIADVPNNAMNIVVTGEASKIITWVATVTINIVTNS